MAAPRFDLTVLNRNILRFAQATGQAAKDVAQQAMKTMVRYAINQTPPGSAATTGLAAKRRGESAIIRDLNLMGFVPVQIKGKKVYEKTFWGHTLKNPPLVIKTKLNPKFADPNEIHRARIRSSKKSGRRGVVSRGGKQAWYVDKRLFNAMKNRLLAGVGKLASGWVPAARQLSLAVPAWIARHAGLGRGTTVQTVIVKDRITLTVKNHFPDTANDVYDDTVRRVPFWAFYASENLDRQLRAKLAGKWGR